MRKQRSVIVCQICVLDAEGEEQYFNARAYVSQRFARLIKDGIDHPQSIYYVHKIKIVLPKIIENE